MAGGETYRAGGVGRASESYAKDSHDRLRNRHEDDEDDDQFGASKYDRHADNGYGRGGGHDEQWGENSGSGENWG